MEIKFIRLIIKLDKAYKSHSKWRNEEIKMKEIESIFFSAILLWYTSNRNKRW